jgi:transcriptional regulator with PAS, ATPase and Fis domain
MHDVTTLITGASGTGKDLVAEAIGLSRYVRFDPRGQRFEEDFGGAFHPVNLSALSPELIESELFGHRKGAFTGAVDDRPGWLEQCQAAHAVFLDEIGELSPAIQVKLLRVLQNRTFHRVGETTPRSFAGKVIAATNRDLEQEVQAGRFRRDFYYRLCSDLIHTPSLHEQLRDCPDELPRLVGFIARRLYPTAAETLTKDVVRWIETQLGENYPWPGNIRELEQCIRNVLVRREYYPLREPAARPQDEFAGKVRNLQLSAEELLNDYCTLVYAQTGSFQATARRLKLDRRTVRQRIDRDFLARLRGA